MELSASECRYFAQECRSLADLAQTIEERIYLREREAAWTQLAEQAERRERAPKFGTAKKHKPLSFLTKTCM
jgi:hypothetical protein